jgi:hypothetical protein
MVSSWMLRRVALVRTDVLEEPSTCFIRVTRIAELGTKLAVTSNRRTLRRLLVTASFVPSSVILVTLMKQVLGSSKTSVLTRAIQVFLLFGKSLQCGKLPFPGFMCLKVMYGVCCYVSFQIAQK